MGCKPWSIPPLRIPGLEALELCNDGAEEVLVLAPVGEADPLGISPVADGVIEGITEDSAAASLSRLTQVPHGRHS